jgi:hypothetical protein
MSIPDEKARVWTRPEDYWPPRRPARSSRPARERRRKADGHADPLDQPRLMLTTIPYAMLMVCLAFLAIAIMVAAWPGRHQAKEPARPVAAEVGTAPKGWLENR